MQRHWGPHVLPLVSPCTATEAAISRGENWVFKHHRPKLKHQPFSGCLCCLTSSPASAAAGATWTSHTPNHTMDPGCRYPHWLFAPVCPAQLLLAFKQMWEWKLSHRTWCLWLLGALMAAKVLPVMRGGWSTWGIFSPLPQSKQDGSTLTPSRQRTDQETRFGVIN